MVEGHAVPYPRAPVVSHHVERVETELPHDLDLVVGGSALAVHAQIAVGSGWLVAVAVSSHIGCHDGVPLGERRGDLVPHHVRLRVAMQEQQRRAAARVPQVDADAVGVNLVSSKSLEHDSLSVTGSTE